MEAMTDEPGSASAVDAGAETTANPEIKNIIEAALLVAGQPLTLDKLLFLFPEDSRPTREELQHALDALAQDCEGRSFELKQIDRGFRFQTRAKYGEWIARLHEERPTKYSRALLETLAIIAYRQPVTRAEIEDIRGVAVSSEIIKTLMGREWVKQVGTRDVPGKPALYGTTRGFLEHFNLKSLDELPPLAELRDIDKIAAELNMQLPMEGGASEADERIVAIDAGADEAEQTPEAHADEAGSDGHSATEGAVDEEAQA
jgi:segregation and condensation protein B